MPQLQVQLNPAFESSPSVVVTRLRAWAVKQASDVQQKILDVTHHVPGVKQRVRCETIDSEEGEAGPEVKLEVPVAKQSVNRIYSVL